MLPHSLTWLLAGFSSPWAIMGLGFPLANGSSPLLCGLVQHGSLLHPSVQKVKAIGVCQQDGSHSLSTLFTGSKSLGPAHTRQEEIIQGCEY